MTSTILFEAPGQERYFEDYVEGLILTFGSITVDEAEIINWGN